MADLEDGDTVEMKGSGANPYVLKNTGGVYSCTCPAWRNQSAGIDKRTCKHLKKLRGDQAELDRIGTDVVSVRAVKPQKEGGVEVEGEDGEDDGKGPPLLLAHRWEPTDDPTGSWMSEKLDGVRAYWDGTQFVSRLGNRYVAPDWFVAGLPATPLDGELWGGRKQFQATVSTVRRIDGGDRWKLLKYVVFDAPAHAGGFEDRLDAVRTAVAGHPYAIVLPHARCTGFDHLKGELAVREALGGEGMMLRRPGSPYEVGRSSTLLKVKNFFDAEGLIVGHEPGLGRHAGRLGSVLVETPDGLRFSVGTGFSDAERGDPPPVGAVVTYRYQELTDAGVPRFPTWVGVRIDADWASVKAAAAPATKSAAKGAKTPKASKAAAGPPAAPVAAGAGRRFEFDDGSSQKFWSVAQDGASFTVTYGRIGTNGQSKRKDVASEAVAAAEVAKLVAEKVGKGYAEV